MKRATRNLGFAVSLLIHGGVLGAVWVWQQPGAVEAEAVTVVPLTLAMFAEQPPAPQPVAAPPAAEQPVPPEPPPTDAMVPPPPQPPTPVARPTPIPPPPHRTPAPVAAPLPAAAPVSPTPAPAVVVAAMPPRAPAVDLAGLRDRYKQALLAAIARHKFYPPRARRRGLEGEAQVRFRIAADGSIGRVELVSGSGAALLDRAAVQTIERLGRVAPLPPELGMTHWDLVVPIDYRLL